MLSTSPDIHGLVNYAEEGKAGHILAVEKERKIRSIEVYSKILLLFTSNI